jgi:hypothetical protein
VIATSEGKALTSRMAVAAGPRRSQGVLRHFWKARRHANLPSTSSKPLQRGLRGSSLDTGRNDPRYRRFVLRRKFPRIIRISTECKL